MDPKKINKIIDFVREEMMTTGSTPGKPGFSGKDVEIVTGKQNSSTSKSCN